MPWRIEHRGNEYCVILETTGEVEGCHPTRREALAQQAALYAAEGNKDSPVEVGMEDKATWTTSYVNNLADSCFLHVEPGGEKDDEGKTVPRSKRHLPYKNAEGQIDLPHLRNAISRLGQPATGEAGGESWLSESLRQRLLARARRMLRGQQKSLIDRLKEAIGWEPEPEPVNAFFVWKEASTWRWLAIYSNKFRDEDSPPEILAEAAHKEFVEAVDNGDWPYPSVRLWHVKNTDWGKADFLAYDDRGFSIASGVADDPVVAENLSLMSDLATSHGMPSREITRDEKDRTIITRYRTEEISPLPAWAAANKLTEFLSADGGTMALPKDKKEFLKSAMGEERAEELEQKLEGLSKEAEGLEFKEEEQAEAEPEQKEETAAEPAEPDAESEPEPAYVTEEQVIEAMGEVLRPLAEQVSALAASVEKMTADLKEAAEVLESLQRSDEEKVQEVIQLTPGASLAARIQSVIGQEQTKVDGRTSLAKSAPAETAPGADGPTAIPFLNQLIAAQRGGFNG